MEEGHKRNDYKLSFLFPFSHPANFESLEQAMITLVS